MKEVSDVENQNVPKQNKAVQSFTDSRQDLRTFESWYSNDILKYLTHSLSRHPDVFRYIFDISESGEIKQLFYKIFTWLSHLSRALKKCVCFIGVESPTKVNHFIFGIMVDDAMLIINPVGLTKNPDFYAYLGVATEHKSSTLKIEQTIREMGEIKHIYLSEVILQISDDTSSCGPICVELMRHISQLPFKTLLKCFETWREKTSQHVDITELLPDSLKELLKGEKSEYQGKILAIRKTHLKLLEAPTGNEKSTIEEQNECLESYAGAFEQGLIIELDKVDLSDKEAVYSPNWLQANKQFSSFWLKKNYLEAIKNGEKDRVEALLNTSPLLLNVLDFKGFTSLMLAIQYNKEDIVKFLLEKNASLDAGLTIHNDAEAFANFLRKEAFAKLLSNKKKEKLALLSSDENLTKELQKKECQESKEKLDSNPLSLNRNFSLSVPSMELENGSHEITAFVPRIQSSQLNEKASANSHEQLGWNCFDIAVGIERQALVKYALENANNEEFRKLLAPEIKHAAMLTFVYMTARKDCDEAIAKKVAEILQIAGALEEKAEKEYVEAFALKILDSQEPEELSDLARNTLPPSMYTKKIFDLVKAYVNAHEAMKDAVADCNDALGNPEGKRYSLEQLIKFFLDLYSVERNRSLHKDAYKIFRDKRNKLFTPHEIKFATMCEKKENYEKYVKDYYGKNGWVSFQRSLTGEYNTSMVDIASRMLKAVIIIYQKEKSEKKEVYRTNNQDNHEIKIIYNGRDHFTSDTQNLSKSSEKKSEIEDEKQEKEYQEQEAKLNSNPRYLNQNSNQRLSSMELGNISTAPAPMIQLSKSLGQPQQNYKSTKEGIKESKADISVRKILEDDLKDETEMNAKLSKPGYLKKLLLDNDYLVKNLHGGFSWPDKNSTYDISMLSVITGKNGIGKSALLEAILQGFEREISHQSQFRVNLTFNKKIEAPTALADLEFHKMPNMKMFEVNSQIPQIFEFSSATSNNKIRGTGDRSAEIHQQIIHNQFQDLKKYSLSKCYNKPYALKYPENQELYNRIIEICLKNSALSVENGNFQHDFESALKDGLENEVGLHISSYGSLDTYPKYLLERITTLTALNDFLKRMRFKYILAASCLNRQGKFEHLTLTEIGRKETIDHYWLSPGERLELLTLLWLFETKIIKETKVGSVFILDEFDAHLHPSLAKEVIEVIKTKLIGEYGVQVIMTTHNSTTVSLVPKECLYIMSDDNSDKKVEIKKAVSKKQAIQKLTSDFVCVNEPIRIIFVEADDDKSFYEILQRHLIDHYIINPEYQLIFESHGRIRIDAVAAEERSLANKNIPEDSTRKQVERLVGKCVGNKDQDKTLCDFIFGLVDGDGMGKSELLNVEALERYAIENYLYDPVHIFFALKRAKVVEEPFKKLQQDIIGLIQNDGLTLPNSLSEVLESKSKNVILQHIINVFADAFLNTLDVMIKNSKDNFKIVQRLKQKRFNLIDSNEKLISGKTPVKFLDDVELNYPIIFLKMRGHDIEDVYKIIFSAQKVKLSMQLMFKFCNDNMLIPLDLAQTLEIFQNPGSQQQKHVKSKKEDKNSKSLQTTLDNQKKSLEDKEDKIKRQADDVKKLEKSLLGSKAKLNKMREAWGAHNNLPQLLKARGIFSDKAKSFEYEDINTVIDTKPLEYKKK